MSQLKIAGNVKIGHVYDCIFGEFKNINGGTTSNRDEAVLDYNYRIPNEIVKNRLVIVIGKHRGQYNVVPVSSTKEIAKRKDKEPEFKGFHVMLDVNDIPTTPRYSYGVHRWALCNLVTTIDGGRLRDLYNSKLKKSVPSQKVSDDTLKKIREGVIISIGMRDLIVDTQE